LNVKDFSSLLPFREIVRGPAQWPAFGDARGLQERVLPHLGINPAFIRSASRRTGVVGTFNVCDFTTKSCVAVPSDDVDLDVLTAAVSLPMLMPGVRTRGTVYLDAVWIKDANVLEAVRRGADEVWLIWCIGNTPRYGDGPFEQYVHMIEMSAGGGLLAELDVLADINRRRAAGEEVFGSTTPVVLHVVKPHVPLPLDPDFFAGRISADTLMDMGHRDACAYLGSMTSSGVPLDASVTAMAEPGLGVRIKERLHGVLDRFGSVTMELVTEVRDVEAFRADPSVAVPVVAHLDTADAHGRVFACEGTFAFSDAGARYEVRLPASQPLERLVCVRPMHGLRDAVHALRTLEVRAGLGSDGLVLGTLHADLADARRIITSLEPTGAHDLAGRAEAVADIGRLFLHEFRHAHN
jgi:hypothetical protein